jgi:hypothetical protein
MTSAPTHMTREYVLDVLQNLANLLQTFRFVRCDVGNGDDIIGYP